MRSKSTSRRARACPLERSLGRRRTQFAETDDGVDQDAGYVRRSQGSPGMPPRQRCPPPWVVQVPLAACGWALVYEVTPASKADRQQTRTASISAASPRMLGTQVNTPAQDAPGRPHQLRRPAARRPACCTEKVGRGVGGTSRFRPTARSKTSNRYDDAWQYGKPRAMQ